jgi:hypothetical protein
MVALQFMKPEGRRIGGPHFPAAPRAETQYRVIEPLRVALLPLGPVQVAECPHVPPEHEELPLRVVVPPLGPV